MYRPNRIGPWPVVDVDQVLLTRTDTNFNTLDGGVDTQGCFRLTAASGEDFCGTNVFWTTSPTIATVSAVGLGVDIALPDVALNHSIQVSGTLNMFSGESSFVVTCILGRLVAAASSTAQVLITSPCYLPITYSGYDTTSRSWSVDTTVILQQGIFGGTVPSTQYNLAAFWHIANEAGAESDPMNQMSIRLSIHKYGEDFHTFDPNR